MHWSTVQLVWHRELRDLFRDRRTIFMIVALPTLLYPLLGLIGWQFALGALEQTSVVGIQGAEFLPQGEWSSGPALKALAGGLPASMTRPAGFPPLILNGHFLQYQGNLAHQVQNVQIQPLPDAKLAYLESKQVDLMMIVPKDFVAELAASRTPGQPRAHLRIDVREGDERSRMAEARVNEILGRWKARLKAVRFEQQGLPADFDNAFDVIRPREGGGAQKRLMDQLTEMVGRFLPFLLIMWAMAGALYPAIDVCAGEKERGTLETLLISPASRSEIVYGKFLAIWVFSAGTALWNLSWMGAGAMLANAYLPGPLVKLSGLLWCAGLTVLLAALFSAVSLALGVFARSTKEGQYYLLPLFLVTMPLTFLPLVPGVELNLACSLIPVTGATLLLQALMSGSDKLNWLYFFPVLLSLVFSIWMALRWAVHQFQSEEVLFRESQRAGLLAWLGQRWRGQHTSPKSDLPAPGN